MTCTVPGCTEPPERIMEDGMCHKHRWAEICAIRQIEWQHQQDVDEAWPERAAEREERERAERQARRARALEQIGRRLDGDGTSYGLAALGGTIRELSQVPEGGRNDALNRASFRVGGLVAGGEIHPACAVQALRDAAEAMGLPEHEAKYVIRRAFDKGLERPKSAPERRAA